MSQTVPCPPPDGVEDRTPLCLCPATSEYDPPCPEHGVKPIGMRGDGTYAESEYPPIIVPTGDFKLVSPGEVTPHDIGCNCPSCVARRVDQAKDPRWRGIVEEKAARLPPDQAKILRKAFGL